MRQQFRILSGLALVVGFFYLFYFAAPFLGIQLGPERCEVDSFGNVISCPHEKQLQDIQFLFPVLVSIAVIVGAATYYFMSGKVELKEKSLKKNTDIILKFLSPDERKLVNVLVENKGKALQAEVTRLPGMNKVKSHRVVQKLIDNGVLEKEQVGKTNVLKFSKEIMEGIF